MATDLSEAAEAVVTLCTDLGIERVKDPTQMDEQDDCGNVCRVCVRGAIELAEEMDVISSTESECLTERAVAILHQRNDMSFQLRTVPTTKAMFALIREAGQRG